LTINYYNLKEQYQEQKFEISLAIHEVAVGGQYFADHSVVKFESLLSRLYNNASVVACNSGTSALTVALKAAKLAPNSYVLIPAFTYVATANAVFAAGLKPICIDIDHHWLMDYKHCEHYLEKHAKSISAVVLVDLYGQGADLYKFKSLCDNYNVKLIIDAAQSFDLMYDYYHQIDYCDSLALSFNPLKNLGAMGNAGAVVSKNYNVEELQKWCIQGKLNNDIAMPGLNCRIDAIQAAVLNVKYLKFDESQKRKAEICHYYRSTLTDFVDMPIRQHGCTHTNYVFGIAPFNVNAVRNALLDKNIQYSCHYEKPLHHYSMLKEYYDYCPTASSLAGKCISLPSHWHLNDLDVDYIVTAVKSSL
jgi:dTDP-4-amino-4,6-dideoxygalactose transaminase